MFAKILGTFDLIIAVIIFMSVKFSFIPQKLLLIAGIFLIIKGLIFVWGLDIASIIEIIAGVLIILPIYITAMHIPNLINYIIILFLVQKGIFSMLG